MLNGVMEREIRYCTTEDGVSIAYVATGEGRLLVSMPVPGINHAELSWQRQDNVTMRDK
jgi:hypothetical protein